MDIIVTTPKGQMANAAAEAADCIRNGGGEYFRRFHPTAYPRQIAVGSRVYYVEDRFIRGFAVVSLLLHSPAGMTCDTTGRVWSQGFYVFMDATSWQWVCPIPMRGFQGFRYVEWGGGDDSRNNIVSGMGGFTGPLEIVGNWRDPRPWACR